MTVCAAALCDCGGAPAVARWRIPPPLGGGAWTPVCAKMDDVLAGLRDQSRETRAALPGLAFGPPPEREPLPLD